MTIINIDRLRSGRYILENLKAVNAPWAKREWTGTENTNAKKSKRTIKSTTQA